MNHPATRSQVMGIINVTPDSFSGDGLLQDNYLAAAVAQAESMIADGADILDIGGESSRPGSTPLAIAEELRRVIPVITAIRAKNAAITLSVDTVKEEVAEQALRAGANIINDISAFTINTGMAVIAARNKADIILMHNRSDAQTATHDTKIGGSFTAPDYKDVVADVTHDLSARAEIAIKSGVPRHHIVVDPGIGFGKTSQHNLALIAHLGRIKSLGFRVLIGVSRKSFIGQTLDVPVNERLEGTAACVTACILHGADIVRVHDVRFMSRVVKMATAVRDA